MTRIVNSLRRMRRTPSLVMLGIALLSATVWVARSTADASPSGPLGTTQAYPGAQLRVVGFGHVDVEGGTVPLSFAVGGHVAEVLVKEGEQVTAGQPLVRLELAQATAQVQEAQSALDQARIHRRQADRAAQNFSIRRQLQEQAIEAAETRAAAQERSVRHVEELVGDDVVPNEQFLNARDLERSLWTAVMAEKLKLKQIELDDPSETVALAEASLQLAIARRAQAEDQLRQHTMTAPDDGIVLRVQLTAGQLTGPTAPPPIWFAPDRPRIVRCEIDQAFADRVHAGLKAEAFDDRIVGQGWTGVVSRCGDWIAPKRSVLDEPFQRNDVRTLECLITLDPGQPELRIGQRMRIVLTSSLAESMSVSR